MDWDALQAWAGVDGRWLWRPGFGWARTGNVANIGTCSGKMYFADYRAFETPTKGNKGCPHIAFRSRRIASKEACRVMNKFIKATMTGLLGYCACVTAAFANYKLQTQKVVKTEAKKTRGNKTTH